MYGTTKGSLPHTTALTASSVETKKISKSFLLLIFSVVLLITVFKFSAGVNGNDFWWHQKAGEWIVEHGEVPDKDIFSWYGMEQDYEWTAHEWLSEVILYKIYDTAGEAGIFLFCLAMHLTTVFLLLVFTKRYASRNQPFYLLLFAISAFAISGFALARPQIFSLLLFLIELNILCGFVENPSRKSIFAIPLITCLWSNLHSGTALLSYGLVFMFLVGHLLNFNIGRIESKRASKGVLMRLGIVLVLSVAAIFANPIGAEAFTYPFVNQSSDFMVKSITEWFPPDAKDTKQLILFFLPPAVFLLGMLAHKDKVRLIDVLGMGFFLLLFLRSVRFIPMLLIACFFFAARYLPELKVKDKATKEEKLLDLTESKSSRCLAAVLSSFLIAGSIAVAVLSTTPFKNMTWVTSVVTDEFVEFVSEEKPTRIFNDYNLSEALIAADIPVFFDARADLYFRNEVLEKGIGLTGLVDKSTGKIYTVDGIFDPMLMIDDFGFDAMVTMNGTSLHAFLSSHPDKFTLTYSDSVCSYYRVEANTSVN
ncbi:MAG: hypothetical protein IKA41_07415 [Bacteroidaceae bacterium]|nr:hypothetical protein [Bacteroidaceae bacterium]